MIELNKIKWFLELNNQQFKKVKMFKKFNKIVNNCEEI